MQLHRLAVVTFACAIAAGAAAAAQSGHQEHATKPAQKQGQQSHKMMMPAMNDATFVQMMSKHHQDGIQMAKVEESKGTRDDVKALAAKIREGQERELQEMQGVKMDAPAGHEQHDAQMQKHHEMMEQMAKASMEKIEQASGAAVDAAFLEEMAMHHDMALQMIAKTTFKNPELKKLSQTMAASQKQELQQLRALAKVK